MNAVPSVEIRLTITNVEKTPDCGWSRAMSYVRHYSEEAPDREDIDQSRGPLVVEFGTGWCGHCQAAQPFIGDAMGHHPSVRHLKIEDGKGRRLGRTFGVKLWPTLIFLSDGQEIARLVRPTSSEPISQALAQIDSKR